MIFCQYLLRNVIYYPSFCQFLVSSCSKAFIPCHKCKKLDLLYDKACFCLSKRNHGQDEDTFKYSKIFFLIK